MTFPSGYDVLLITSVKAKDFVPKRKKFHCRTFSAFYLVVTILLPTFVPEFVCSMLLRRRADGKGQRPPRLLTYGKTGRCALILCSRNLVNFVRNNKRRGDNGPRVSRGLIVSISFIAGLPEPLDRDVDSISVPRFCYMLIYILIMFARGTALDAEK